MLTKPWIVAAVLLVASGSIAQAQTRRASMLPAETPPADFAEGQYVDSRGCAFVRAGSNGQVTWLPLFGDDREPVCGLRPSAEAGPPQPARVVIRQPPPEPTPEPTPEPEAEVAEAPATEAREPVTPEPEPTETASGDAPAAPGSGVAPEAAEVPFVIAAAQPQYVGPRYTLRVIERRGSIVEVLPDPYAPSVLNVIERRGLLFYPDT
jgi:outer membrane biosynthesis protein TonB